ncbi:tail protein X [Marinobacter sp. NFXS9]|uniref:tail protein X n=1 Tax=Marinobacter sp. NFXS9 TaxID=2818433 RepID=UPI0032DF3ED5
MAADVRAIQGDTVDRICYRHYGYTAGVTEAVYEANPGLAELGPILPTGTKVTLPEVAEAPTRTTVQLWD